ncbi:MAG: class 1a ribonucleoside-diphosphate reductase subunit alpha [Candidatus Dasytiphilus stammeri]
MNPNWFVTKRDSRIERLNLEKIHRIMLWASEGLHNISISKVEMLSHIQLYNGIQTSKIHQILIKVAADMICSEHSDYQYLAARLGIFNLRKKAYGQFQPPKLYDQVQRMVNINIYDPNLLKFYTKEEFEEMDNFIDHSRDMKFSYAAVKQLESKYLVQNRVNNKIYESPQFIYILVAACLFSRYPPNIRKSYIKRFYDATSTFKISLPTPILAGVRTCTKQFSSCVLVECDDNLDSINATASVIVKYISQRAGIGINAGRIRALGSTIREGGVYHMGCIPFYKHFQSAVKSCSQGGIRGGAATLFYPLWHLEVENLLVLKNNRGIEENRVRHIDYAVQINKLMYQRLINEEEITLFNPCEVSDLYEAFFADQKKFERLYRKYEQEVSIRKKRVKAVELFCLLMQERASTGRIYIQHVDNCNTHSAFNPHLAPIRQSNLCLEITLPTTPLQHIHDHQGEIAVCTLSAFNLGLIKNLNELEELAVLAVRALDALLDYQNYPIFAAKRAAIGRRPLGIGVINFAYYLAKNGVRYSDGSAKNLTHKTFEALQYYLLKASNELAQEQGACPWFNETTYAQGLLPIDTYKKTIDTIVVEPLHYDWETLRMNIKKYGLRNSTLSSLMPSESSSQISNATNGIEPPRGCITVKTSKDGILHQVVPDLEKLNTAYEYLWDMPNNEGYLQLVGIMQKFIDQSISANTSYDPESFSSRKLPMKQLLKDIITAWTLGIKTLYYHNTRDRASDQLSVQIPNHMSENSQNAQPIIIYESNNCDSGACKI